MLKATILLITLVLSGAFAAPLTMATARSPNGIFDITLISTTKPNGKQVGEIALRRVATGTVIDTIEIMDDDKTAKSLTVLWSPDSSYVAINGSNGQFTIYPVSDDRGFRTQLQRVFSPETTRLYEAIQAKLPPGDLGRSQVERWINASTISVVDSLARVRCRYEIRERDLTITSVEPIPNK